MEGTATVAGVAAEVRELVGTLVEREAAGLLSGDLGALEAGVQGLLRRVGGALVGGLLAAGAGAADEGACCPSCGVALRAVGMRERRLVGLVGEYRLARPYYYCRACRAGHAPRDAALGLGAGSLSPGLARVAGRAGLEAAFDPAVGLVEECLGLALDGETVRGLAAGLGRLAEADQREPGPVPGCGAAGGEAAPACLVVEVDGVLVRERDAWHEAKVARVAPLGPATRVDPESGREQLALGPSSYAVGYEDADAFWARAAREAHRRGLGRGVATVVLLADGADWIWRQGRTQLGPPGVAVVEIVDFFHAHPGGTRHLGAVATAVFARTPARQAAWLVPLRQRLRAEGAPAALRALGRLRADTAAAREAVRLATGYFTRHAARMDYPAFLARRLPIGSGAIESACKAVVQQRQVQAGMRWSHAGAQHLASLRALHRSGRWDAFWAARPLHRLRLLPDPAPDHAAPAQLPDAAPTPDAAPAPTPDAAPPASPPPAPRIQAAGKPWWRGRDWRARPACSRRSA